MSIKVVYDAYTDICGAYGYGKNILNLPDNVQESINEFFDGQTIEGDNNPDNIYMNYLMSVDFSEICYDLNFPLSKFSDFENIEEMTDDEVQEFLEENLDVVNEFIKESYTFLGYDSGEWYYF